MLSSRSSQATGPMTQLHPPRTAVPSSVSESAISRVIHQLTTPPRFTQGDSSDILAALYASFDLTPASNLSTAFQSPMGSVLREVQTSARDIITQLATLVTVYKGIQQDTSQQQQQQPTMPQSFQQQQQQPQQRLARNTARQASQAPTRRDLSSSTQTGDGRMGPVFTPFQQPLSHLTLPTPLQFPPPSDQHDSLARFFQAMTTPRMFMDDGGRAGDYSQHSNGNGP